MRRIAKPRLVIMLKEPRAGRVKTRLGKDIGMTAAAWWFRHQSSRLIRILSKDKRWETRLAVAPWPAARASRAWPWHIPKDSQGLGDLGDRMRHIFENTPSGPTIIIGADIPGVTPAIIHDAFEKLRRFDSVFGPASDGGFWLVGMHRGPRPLPDKLFENVRWSSEYALRDTLATLGDASVGFVQTLSDVDTASDLT